ncbi:MAG: polysaccharide deacetylase family protein, partial [Solirubrobacteraceae bacterium]
ATEKTKSLPDLTVEPANFDAQMAAIVRAGYHTISQVQLFDALARGKPLPRKPVMITVDDGYIDDVRQILPELRRRRMIATFYIITSRFREPGFVNEDQVRELERSGMDIGAHTRTHANLPALDSAALKSEVAGSGSDLKRVLGHPVYWFAYPYGAFDATVVQAARAAGFVLAVTTRGGTRESSQHSLTLSRIHVGRASTPSSLLACLAPIGGCGGPGG